MANYIFIKNKRLNYYDTFSTYQEAHKIGLYYKRKVGGFYWILIVEKGFPMPHKVYKLYLSKLIRIGW